MDLNETCSDSVICGSAGNDEPVKDPLMKLVEDWGYEQLLPENVIEWPTLPYWIHLVSGIYLFISGKDTDSISLLFMFVSPKRPGSDSAR